MLGWLKDWLMPEPRVTEQSRETFEIVQGDLWRMKVQAGTEWAPSIPEPVQAVVPITEAVWRAALWHDELYIWKGRVDLADFELERVSYDGRLGKGGKPSRVGREFADDFFMSAMRAEGVGWLHRHLIFWAVRAFGWPAWAEEDKALEKAQSHD